MSSGNTPMLCAKKCGFYGSPANRDLCSKCYQDFLKEEILLAYDHQSACTDSIINSSLSNLISLEKEINDDDFMAKNKTNRCLCCKRKIGLLGFSCRCGGKYCDIHRHPEKHTCSFDYKTVGRAILARENILVAHDKLEERL